MYRSNNDDEIDLTPDYRLASGITIEDMAQSARKVFLGIVCQDRPEPWVSLRTEKKERWIFAAGVVAQVLITKQDGIRWETLTKEAHRMFHGEDRWLRESQPVRLAWEAAVRHMVNIGYVEQDGGDDEPADEALGGEEIAELESNWKDWVAKRLITDTPTTA